MLITNGDGCTDILLNAARYGRRVNVWVNAHVPGTTDSTVVTTGAVYNLPAGQRFFLTDVFYSVENKNQSARFELGGCSAVDGGGTFTPGAVGVFLEATAQSVAQFITLQGPGAAVNYSDGARSIACRVTASTIDTIVTIGIRGFIESESWEF